MGLNDFSRSFALPVLVFALSLTSIARAEGLEKADFRGVVIGAANDPALPGLLGQFDTCKRLAASLQGVCAVQFPDLGSLRAEGLTLKVSSGSLETALVVFHPRQFEGIVEALLAKLGKPDTDTVESMQNGYGAKFEGRSLTWMAKDGTLVTCRQFAGRIDRASLGYFSKSAQAAMQASKPKAADL